MTTIPDDPVSTPPADTPSADPGAPVPEPAPDEDDDLGPHEQGSAP